MDRRIRRTRTAVFNAVLDLMVEKDTSKITVLELCKRADINKSTFYLHYKSMEDCLQNCFQIIMNGIIDISKNHENRHSFLVFVSWRNIDYLSKFKSSSICAPAIKMLKENLVSSISQSNGFNIEDNYFEVSTITFAVAGCIDALIEPLPVFNKEELGRAIVSMLKSSKN